MTNMKLASLVVVLVLVVLGFSSLYTIDEGQDGLLLRLGQFVRDNQGEPKVYSPGLHFKIPFINQAHIFDTRLQTLDVPSSRIMTEEKKDVLVDYYVKWRIVDLPQYFTSTGGDKRRAENLLQQQVNNGLRAQFGQRNISEVVSGTPDGIETDMEGAAFSGRADIMQVVQENVNRTAKELGVDVVDVRIRRIDLPEEVSTAVYERMRAERERIASKHRADGRAAAEAIRAKADEDSAIIVAQAHSDGLIIRGQGDAQAAQIYAEAYTQDEDFFTFYRSINAYKATFANKQDLLVLQPDSDFFRYFQQAMGTSEQPLSTTGQ